MFWSSQDRTRSRNASWSGVSEKSNHPSRRNGVDQPRTEPRFILGTPPRRVKTLYSQAMVTISLPRLRSRIETLARFGGLPGGGVTRPAWSPTYEEARGWLVEEMGAAGLATWIDPAGNTFGGLGTDGVRARGPVGPAGPPIDTVPAGGHPDGALGVLAGLEGLHAIQEAGLTPRRPLAVAAWIDEEGRYGSLFGSRAFCGNLDAARIGEMTAVDGERLIDVMKRAGFDPSRVPEAKAPVGSVAAYVELHIEQGPRLEEAGIPIGVVEAIVGVRRTRLIFRGQADHAGTTPMERRRDAFLASADYALRARESVVTRGSAASVTNIGVVQIHPGASNIVPGRAELVHEMRDPDPEILERLADECAALAHDVARSRGIEVDVRPMSATLPARCAPRVQAVIEQS